MKSTPRLSMRRLLVLITVAGALSGCSYEKAESEHMALSELHTTNPRGYLNAFTPHEREMAIMDMARSEFRRR